MGKKKHNSRQKKQQQQQQTNEAWEADSVYSDSTELSTQIPYNLEADNESKPQEDPLYDLMEALYEKRTTTRLTSLRHIVHALTQSVLVEDCQEKGEELLNRVVNCISKGGSDEVLLACRVLGLLCLTLGMEDDNEKFIKSSLVPFKKVMKQSSKLPACKGVVLDTVALLCFVSVDDREILMECLKMLESQFENEEMLVQLSSLRGWSLIISNLADEDIDVRRIENELFGQLTYMLQVSNVDVRGAAGEALAVINHRFSNINLEEFIDEQDEDWDSQTADSASMSTVMDGMEGVKDRMRDLVKNRGEQQRRSKRDLASQRSQFRELLQLVEHGEVKREELKLRFGDRLVIEGLEAKIQLNALRRYLGSGLQEHLHNNELLHNIFDFWPTTVKPEKKVYSSAYSKAKTMKRNSDRKKASEKKGGGYDYDDY